MEDNLRKFRDEIRLFFGKEYPFLILAALIGVLAGTVASLFVEMIALVESIFYGNGLPSLHISGAYAAILYPFFPMLGGMTIGLARHYFSEAIEENGVHNVIESVVLKNGRLKKRTILVCSVTSSITIGTGGSAGRVAPTVQISAAIGSAFGQFLRMSTERVRLLLGCGAAAGIAATFNAPLAGVLFAIEIILDEFTLHTFSPLVIASVMGTITGRAIEGNQLVFHIPVHQLAHPAEILLYIVLGLVCGLSAHVFTQTFFRTQDFFESKVRLHTILKPALGGLMVGLLAMFTPEIRGNGFEHMETTLNGQMAWWLAFALIFTKTAGTAFTLGSGGIGGTFAPSLFVGTMVGAVFGTAVHTLFPDWTATSETYALVGMGALASAVLKAPLTGILVLFEMTNDHTIILPIMASCIVSTYTMRHFNRHSIFVQTLINKGIDIQKGRAATLLKSIPVRKVMKTEIQCLPESMPFRKILETVSFSKSVYYPVLNEDGEMTGILSFSDIRQVLFNEGPDSELTAKDLATTSFVTLHPNDNLSEAMEKFSELDVEEIPVVSPVDPKKPIAMLSRNEVLAVYNREILMQEIHT